MWPIMSVPRDSLQRTLGAAIILACLAPSAAWCCGGPAGQNVAITFDGQKYTVTNMGRQLITVVFTAYNATYNLELAPGQSSSPYSPGTFGNYMSGYQSCVATQLPSR